MSLHSESNLNAFAWTEGLRAAIGISTPVAIGLLTGHLAWGILAGFAVLWILSSDLGGAYRQKAVALAGSAVTIIVAYFFGIWMTWSATNYVAGTFVWVFLAALIGVAGSAAAQAGLVSSTIVITSVALIAPGEYGTRLIACLIGMGWALLLCLALWPLRAYSPIFQALAMSCARLANLADAVWLGAATVERPATNFQFATAYDGLMTVLERCRNIWGALRARRAGPTARSMQLLLLIEQLDDLGKTLVAFREMVNLVGREPWFTEFRPYLESLTHAMSELGREISEAIALRGKNVDASGVENLARTLEARLNLKTDQGSPASFQRKELVRTIKHLVEQFLVLAEIASELRSGHSRYREPPEARFGPRPQTFNPIAEIRNSLSLRSSSFQHALRLGAATTFAALLASTFQIARGYWIPMTVVLVLKPNFGGTLQRSAQRVTGTLLGALLAALLISFCSDPWLLVLGVGGLAFATFTLRNRNYGLFAMALTPLVMLLLDLAHPGTVTDSFLRIFHTMIGSVVALLGGYLLFPTLEVRRFPAHIYAAFRAEAAFLRAFGDLVRGKEKRPMAEFRRDTAVAVSNAATAAERLLAEPSRLR
ncbi:MAG: FUSC family protein, partial [Verrucomicrobia bacterium]|nr:FUSC family protein [Verrucomicrobiota bacterium]